jgi:tetratricopeptide (TPR) repeat protein
MRRTPDASGMVHHRLLLVTAILLTAMAAACTQITPATPAEPAKAADFETALSRLVKNDPQSPETLNARLQYADFLAGESGEGCEQRLEEAQSQLDLVAGSPALDMLLPLAKAQITDGKYRIHLARATCLSRTPLESELRLALVKAKDALLLYRDALDYQSAALMQFNVAAAYQQLGDVDDAILALQTAITHGPGIWLPPGCPRQHALAASVEGRSRRRQ